MNRSYYDAAGLPAPVYSDEELYDLVGVSDDRVLDEEDSVMAEGLEYLQNLLMSEERISHGEPLE